MKQGWQTKTIGELFETGSGGTPLKMHNEYYEGGDIPWLRSGEVCKKYITETELFITKLGFENSSAKYFPTDTIVVAMYGATAGQVGILKFRTTTNQAVCGILPNTDFIPEFVYYVLLNKQKELVSQATGNAQPNISQIKIKNLPIPLLSLSEQQCIVALLDAEFAKIDAMKANAEKNLQNAKDLFQAALKKELEPKEGWKTMHLNEVASYSIGLTYKPDNVNQNGIIVLRSSNIQNDELDLNDIVRVDCVIKEELYVREGDILMCSRNGSRRLVGKVAKIGVTKERMTFGTFMTIIRSDYNPILFYFFKTKSFRNQLETGENPMINQITKYMLNDVVVSIPSSLTEQDTVVARLDALSEKCKTLQANYEKTLSLCDGLKQALLRKAFNGEI